MVLLQGTYVSDRDNFLSFDLGVGAMELLRARHFFWGNMFGELTYGLWRRGEKG